jgi:hypothetical protein
MGPVAHVACHTVAPLLARHNDPDLTEEERVQLSMHLLICTACRDRLQEYRALERRVRTLPSMTIAPRVRDAVLGHIAAAEASMGGSAMALTWRHAWPGATIALSLATFIFAAGLTTALAAQRTGGPFVASGSTSEALARPLMTNLLVANPTRIVSSGVTNNASDTQAFSRPVVKAQATRPAAVGATIRMINPSEGRIVVSIDGAARDERLVIMRDTAIMLADGRPGSLADLVVGAQVQLQREVNAVGGVVAREIVISR